MKFAAEGRVEAPIELVYEMLSVRLTELVPFMANVAAIEELERKPGDDGGVYVLNRWRAEPGNAPAAARPFLKPEMLVWLDHASWSLSGRYVDWRIEPGAFKGLFACAGRNALAQEGAFTTLRITGELTIDPKKVPGLPSFVAKRAVPPIESYLIERIKPNLASLADGVGGWLAAGNR